MKRRNFIKLTSCVSATTLLPNELFALFSSFGMDSCPNVSNRKVVLIELSGGNDGLNTIVPLDQYDRYKGVLRPTTGLNNVGEANGIINLDSTLALEDQVGLHPVLTPFKNMYDEGNMHVIQGVGYPRSTKSHFKSMDYWHTGGDGNALNSALAGGWMGRFIENYYTNILEEDFPAAIQLGSYANSLIYKGVNHSGFTLNLHNQDTQGFYTAVSGVGVQAPDSYPSSDYGDLLQHIVNSDSSTTVQSFRVSQSFNSGTNSATVTYDNNTISNQLKTVARLISGGLETKVYLVRLGGFDTHADQVVDGDVHTGRHANLLTYLSQGVENFFKDLNDQGLADDVIAVTYSEFGRKYAENASFGTDHGEVAPMFVFGNAIEGGVSGTNINLDEATELNNWQVKTVQHDYRSMFATIVQEWLGASDATVNLALYDYTEPDDDGSFTSKKIPSLINADVAVGPDCHKDEALSTNNEFTSFETNVYPNPASNSLNVVVTDNELIKSISLVTLDGKTAMTENQAGDDNRAKLDISHLTPGSYIVQIHTDTRTVSKKVLVAR